MYVGVCGYECLMDGSICIYVSSHVREDVYLCVMCVSSHVCVFDMYVIYICMMQLSLYVCVCCVYEFVYVCMCF